MSKLGSNYGPMNALAS
uniref:Uncharacterized protein n=1 Tax=Moniliophthora roreri TaxID=221103 RepID=A0A0W0FA53_MONRR